MWIFTYCQPNTYKKTTSAAMLSNQTKNRQSQNGVLDRLLLYDKFHIALKDYPDTHFIVLE